MGNLLNEEISNEGFVLLKILIMYCHLKLQPTIKQKSVCLVKLSQLSIWRFRLGGGNDKNAISLYESLQQANFDVNPELKKFYESNKSGSGRAKNPAIGVLTTGLAIGETPQDRYSEDIKNSFANYNDAAIIVISRIGGEGFDLPRTQETSYGGKLISGSKEGGQHYLELDKNEEDLIKMVTSSNQFNKVIVLINSSAAMELGDLHDNDDIDSILWIGSPGGNGSKAIGRILNGTINPSGRLVDTYVRDFTKDPTWQNFGDNMTKNGNAYLTGDKESDIITLNMKKAFT